MRASSKPAAVLGLLAAGSIHLSAQTINIYPAIELEFSAATNQYYQIQALFNEID